MIELSYNCFSWFKRYHFLYIYGALIYFRPIDPFLYKFALETKNITAEQYNNDIYPVSVYSALTLSLLIFVFISFCLFNYVFIISTLGAIVFSVCVWQCDSAVELQVAEGVRGCIVATEIIYFASIYVCKGAKKDFLHRTSRIRAVPLIAQMIAGCLAETCLARGWLSYSQLAFLSVPAAVHAFFVMFHLPALYETEEPPSSLPSKYRFFVSNLKGVLSNGHVLQWTIWSGCTLAGYTQLKSRMQPLWLHLSPEKSVYNGAVEGLSGLLAFLAVLLSNAFQMEWKYHRSILLITSSTQALILFIMAYTADVWLSNICYVIFSIVYYFVTTSLSAKLAEEVAGKGSLGMAFAFIGVISALFNLVIAFSIDSTWIGMTFQGKFMANGGYHMALAGLVIVFRFLANML